MYYQAIDFSAPQFEARENGAGKVAAIALVSLLIAAPIAYFGYKYMSDKKAEQEATEIGLAYAKNFGSSPTLVSIRLAEEGEAERTVQSDPTDVSTLQRLTPKVGEDFIAKFRVGEEEIEVIVGKDGSTAKTVPDAEPAKTNFSLVRRARLHAL